MSIAFEKSWKQLAAAISLSREQSSDEPLHASRLCDTERAMISAIPTAASIHMRNGRLVFANTAFQENFGLSGLNEPGFRFLDDVNPQDKVKVLNAIGNASANADPVTLKRHTHNENQLQFVATFQLQCSPYERSSTTGDEGLVLCVYQDLTETIDAQEKLLVEANQVRQHAAEQAQFFAAMSHELRTPLNAILGFSELLEGKLAIPLADDKRVEYAGHIHQSASHLLSVINDVLDLSKLDAGKLELSFETLDLKALLEDTMRSLKPIASEKQVMLSLNTDQDLPLISADARALRQIFTNLISNAVKFSNGPDEVTIEVKRRRKTLCVSVRDHGIGMDNETLEHLGNVFFQANPAISKEYEGSGLGLSIVQSLVELMGGKLEVESRLNVGSTFTVQVPIAIAASVPVPASPENEVIYLKKERAARSEESLPIARQNGGI